MISHKHKYIFVHIPKTGGTSIEDCLLSLEGIKKPRVLRKLPTRHKREYHLDHKQNQVHSLHRNIALDLRRQYFSFLFVRNPYDKVVSEYNWSIVKPKLQLSNASLLEFLHMSDRWDPHHKPLQVDFLDEYVDFVGRFENLQEDFNVVCDKIGIPQQKLPHFNATKHKHYTEYYDDETRQIVAEKYAKDIEYFDYEFGE